MTLRVPQALHFQRIAARDVSSTLLRECSELFSTHYGKWAADHPKHQLRGKPIRLPPERISDYIMADGWIATARTTDLGLVGYAIAAWIRHGSGTISWVTQLVVHTDFRQQMIGSRLLDSIWGQSDHFAWGIASASPFAIRALEKATRRRCYPRELLTNEKARLRAQNAISYLRDHEVVINDSQSVINTNFCQDLSSSDSILEKVTDPGTPWTLGRLPPCHEWLGMTFRPQEPREWTDGEFQKFLESSSEIVSEAYERMAIANPEKNHPWAHPARAAAESRFLVQKMDI